MSGGLSRDVPKGAAAVTVALALVAGVVTGREPPAAAPAKSPPLSDASAPIEEIDLKLLARMRGDREVEDLFATPASAIPVAALPQAAQQAPAKPQAEAAPTAPPLPFTYLGRMTKGEQVIVYLLRNQELLLARPGDVLDQNYRVERISESTVELTYVPLGTRQLLALP